MMQTTKLLKNWLKYNTTKAQLIPFSISQTLDLGAFYKDNNMEVKMNQEEFSMETEYKLH